MLTRTDGRDETVAAEQICFCFGRDLQAAVSCPDEGQRRAPAVLAPAEHGKAVADRGRRLATAASTAARALVPRARLEPYSPGWYAAGSQDLRGPRLGQ